MDENHLQVLKIKSLHNSRLGKCAHKDQEQ